MEYLLGVHDWFDFFTGMITAGLLVVGWKVFRPLFDLPEGYDKPETRNEKGKQ